MSAYLIDLIIVAAALGLFWLFYLTVRGRDEIDRLSDEARKAGAVSWRRDDR